MKIIMIKDTKIQIDDHLPSFYEVLEDIQRRYPYLSHAKVRDMAEKFYALETQ